MDQAAAEYHHHHHGLRMDQLPSGFPGDPHASLGYPHHHQGWPTKLDHQAATMHSMMSLCRVDFPPFKMQNSLGNQNLMYGVGPHGSFEGILELRKEKSRDAARSRRGKENYEYYELAKMLPLPGAITSQLDKASIIRLTISFLKLKDFSYQGDPPWERDHRESPNKTPMTKGHSRHGRTNNITVIPTEMFETHHGTHILQSLDGFAFALSNDGRFLYISETVSIYLGLSQVEMTGSSVFDYVHVQDHKELAEQMALNLNISGSSGSSCTSPSAATLSSSAAGGSGGGDSGDQGDDSTSSRAVTPTMPERTTIMTPNVSKGYERTFCIRMKSTLTKRGVHVKCSGYRVVQILTKFRPQFSFSLARKHPPPIMGLVGLAIALPPPTITELLIDNDMFVSRLSPELSVTYVEPKICEMMDLTSDDLTGESLYNRCHAEDLQKLRKAHIDLLSKGQVLTDYYRLMNKHGGFIWIQTCATIIYNSKNQDEQNIIAINYVLSGVEYAGCVMDMNQLSTLPNHQHDHSDHSESEHGPDRTRPHEDHHTPSPSHDYHHHPHTGSASNTRRFTTSRGHKRKHSSSQDMECTRPSVQQLLDFGSVSPHQQATAANTFQMMYNHHDPTGSSDIVDGNMNSLYSSAGSDEASLLLGDDKNSLNKHDCKNSRRKMDKPRKRKKDLEAELNNSKNSGGKNSNSNLGGGSLDLIHQNRNSTSSSLPIIPPVVSVDTSLQDEIASLEDAVNNVKAGCNNKNMGTRRSDSVHSLPVAPVNSPPELIVKEPPINSSVPILGITPTTPIPEDLTVPSPAHPILSPTGSGVGSLGTGVEGGGGISNSTYMHGGCGEDGKTSISSWPSALNSPTPPISAVVSEPLSILPSSPSSVLYPQVSSSTTMPPICTTSSVRDLEEVMNRHLPITPAEAEHLRSEYAQSLLGLQKHKSAIQWVGSGATATPVGNDLTATNLLRSLYANRETVIRTNAVYTPRPQYYSDVQSSLLTPPGATTDPYKDTFSSTTSKSSPPISTSYMTNNMTHYNSTNSTLPTANLVGGGLTGLDPVATGYNSMTPPSSVSPQEKYASASYGDQLLQHYGSGLDTSVNMPIKPQAYGPGGPLPAHSNSHLAVAGYERASQYAAYYAPAAYSTHYRDHHTKNSAAMW